MNKTVLIKLSGESLSGKNGHGLDFIFRYCNKQMAIIIWN